MLVAQVPSKTNRHPPTLKVEVSPYTKEHTSEGLGVDWELNLNLTLEVEHWV